MVDARRLWAMAGCLLLWTGCADEGPPLDELPLRDALRAAPEVVAGLSDGARARLAARFEAARSADVSADALADAATPAAEARALDEARSRREADALVVGAIADGFGRTVFADSPAGAPSLPPLEGVVAGATASLEASALAGAAGPSLRGLFAASSARRFERVVGWPVGAIAIGDTVYVNAAWLVSLAPSGSTDGGGADGQASGAAAVTGASPAASPAVASGQPDGGIADGGSVSVAFVSPPADAGTSSSQPPPSSGPSFWDACSASSDSCDSSDDSCDDSSGGYGQDNSCSGTSDGYGYSSGDGCSSSPDDGSSCRVAPGRQRPRSATLVWVLAPLGFLIGRRR
jgi:hypothetical protein